MGSKQLSSILGSAPSATAKGQSINLSTSNQQTVVVTTPVSYSRIVASIPQTLKDEIRQYIRDNKGETETTIVLKALKKFGFTVDQSEIVDKRSIR